ncbi:MAG: hypothetical protein J7L15_00220 [Clostridiales bacterium]|nr:hypothetical protein [Clostridiales bacterium]
MKKYDQYKSTFIHQFLTQQVKGFTDFAKQKKWIKKSVSENGTLAKIKPLWESEALARIGKIGQELEDRLVKDIEITKIEAFKAKRLIFDKIEQKLKTENLTVTDLKRCWEIVRTEAEEPLRINKQRSSNNPMSSLADLLSSLEKPIPDSTIE